MTKNKEVVKWYLTNTWVPVGELFVCVVMGGGSWY
jgi:hypothetical protein